MSRYIVNPKGVASEHFPDETIILNLPKGNYYSVRGTGQLIWAQLEQGADTDHIVQALSDSYAVNSNIARPSLESFLHRLAEEELIKQAPTSGTAMPAVNAPNSLGQPFTEPVLEVYTDMQELLMLDPIHDADPDKGWPYKTKV